LSAGEPLWRVILVPGLSELDSSGQILAYALILGYAQQLLTNLIDKQGEHLLASAPGKDTHVDRPQRETAGRRRQVPEEELDQPAPRPPAPRAGGRPAARPAASPSS
jgi:hypothetical protein